MSDGKYHAFTVPSGSLSQFLDKVNEHDPIMGGNQVTNIIELPNGRCTVVIRRRMDYPYVINELKTLEESLR